MSELNRPEEENVLHATLKCVTPPSEEQISGFKEFLHKHYHTESVSDVDMEIITDPSVHGGFVLDVGSDEYDWSTKGRERQFERKIDEARRKASLSADEGNIMEIMKGAVEQFKLSAKASEVGTVESCGDGIVTISGLDHVQYGEIVVFDNGVKGMVQNIGEDNIGAILFDQEGFIGEGSRVTGTGRRAGIAVSEDYLGRVVDALGNPIDGGAPIVSDEYRPIEEPAPGIIDRQPVTVPLQTGILAIDSMFPIGRGQRELIIGDRQTGKTSIAMDTILNQKGKDCICIYVAIGQKASTIASLVQTLKAHDAMDYSIVMVSTASDPAPLQYVAPYAATSLAEYFMYRGKDVLIVYDDLSKHAVAYRALSLLLGRSPGREAYPGDVFYLHSRLLERCARLSEELGGGSITALPIIETQDGDVSAYIPTNVISITDGQIFLESDLFFEGQRPAVNVGLSVSRVGGAAQTSAMKKATGSLRIDLAQYRELQVFTQFSSDLDDTTKNQLAQGQVLMELLKQPLGRPLSMVEQVITLYVAEHKKMIDVPVKEVKDYQMQMLAYFASQHPEIDSAISKQGRLDDATAASILKIADEFRAKYDADKKGAADAAKADASATTTEDAQASSDDANAADSDAKSNAENASEQK